jgi:hypothetical protein
LRLLQRDFDGGGVNRFDAGDDAGIVEAAELRLEILEGPACFRLRHMVRVGGVLPVVKVRHHGVGVEAGAVWNFSPRGKVHSRPSSSGQLSARPGTTLMASLSNLALEDLVDPRH